MGKFVKRQELEAAGTPLKMSKVYVLETVNHMAASQIDVGFAAAATLSRALKEKKVIQLQCLELRKECAIMLAIIVSKIKKVLFSTILLGSLQIWIQELWCHSQKMLWRCFNMCWMDLLKRSVRLVNEQMLNLLSTGSSSLKPRSITTTNLLHTVLPRKDWKGFWVSCLTTKRSMRNCGSHLGSFLHCLMDKLQQREDFLSTRKFLLQNLQEMSLREKHKLRVLPFVQGV